MKYTYLLNVTKIKAELDRLWKRYQEIIKNNASWEEINEARAILFLLGHVYCEEIAVKAIERRLHLLKEKINVIEFFNLIDKNDKKLSELRKDRLFSELEKFYKIIKEFKNKYQEGKYYLDEEKFLEKYREKNPDKNLKLGYKGKF